MTRRVALLGASGFVGGHVAVALRGRGAEVVAMPAPRVRAGDGKPGPRQVEELVTVLQGCQIVVNAAGLARATGRAEELDEANHLLPRLLAPVCAQADVPLVHVSSAAVQGARPTLDSTGEHAAFSPYSRSKAAGEIVLLEGPAQVCVYRPPGVHGADRDVTRSLVRLARSRAASVAAPGTGNTAQALIGNVADAVAFLATTERPLPPIVHHPSEGLTTAGLLTALGGRRPRMLPRRLTAAVLAAAFTAARARAGLEGHARRLEVLWHGQDQAPSWLTAAGWRPPEGLEKWAELGRVVRAELDAAGPRAGRAG